MYTYTHTHTHMYRVSTQLTQKGYHETHQRLSRVIKGYPALSLIKLRFFRFSDPSPSREEEEEREDCVLG